MKITALVENRSDGEVKAVHGLSLHIETAKRKILFDVGPDETIFENSKLLGIDLAKVDTVILSHGHCDHGGALEQFLKENHTARVYAQRKAFEPHYSITSIAREDISVASHLKEHPQVTLLDGDYKIDDELLLFTTPSSDKFFSAANGTLYNDSGKDDFAHEQSLMIFGDTNVLIMGCGHAGVVNILERAAPYGTDVCIGGYHLKNPVTKETVPDEFLGGLAQELAKHKVRYYTCHCTGEEAFDFLAARLPEMKYLSCGETIVFS